MITVEPRERTASFFSATRNAFEIHQKPSRRSPQEPVAPIMLKLKPNLARSKRCLARLEPEIIGRLPSLSYAEV